MLKAIRGVDPGWFRVGGFFVLSFGVCFALHYGVGAQSIGGTEDVHIVAKKLDDGRIEFGLEQGDKRILPRSRFFPADAPEGRWLRSSPVAVEGRERPAHRIEGTGEAYEEAGFFEQGQYRCAVRISGNGDRHYSITSYGEREGEYGELHTNGIGSEYSGSSRLNVHSDGRRGDVSPGVVSFEVKAQPSASWSINCVKQ